MYNSKFKFKVRIRIYSYMYIIKFESLLNTSGQRDHDQLQSRVTAIRYSYLPNLL